MLNSGKSSPARNHLPATKSSFQRGPCVMQGETVRDGRDRDRAHRSVGHRHCCCFLKKDTGSWEEGGEETGAGLLEDSMSCAQCIRKVLKTAKAPHQTYTAVNAQQCPGAAESPPSSPCPSHSTPENWALSPLPCPSHHGMARVSEIPPMLTWTSGYPRRDAHLRPFPSLPPAPFQVENDLQL